MFAGVPLGTDDGPGFGWRNVDALKLGGSYRLDERWTPRGGLSYARQPIPASQTFFNTLTLGVVETHLTLGASWKVGAAGTLLAPLLRRRAETAVS